MKRNDLINAIKFAGYHSDARTFTRLTIENRISIIAAGQAYARGIEARKAGQRCGCGDCAVPQ